MKLSLIVTVYNRLEYSRNIIKCLLDQEDQVDELIFADDGSKEKLRDYIEDLLPRCNFKVKHVYQEDIGFRLSRSRNNGAREAEGDFLIYLDQDIIFPKNFIKEIKEKVKKNRFIIGKAIMSEEDQKNEIQKIIDTRGVDYKAINKVIRKEQTAEYIKYNKKDNWKNFLHGLGFKKRGAKIAGLFFGAWKDDFVKLNGFDEKFKAWGFEDDDFCNRLYGLGLKSIVLDFKESPLVHMHHPYDPTKKESPNEGYYRERKKEILKKNSYRCENGYLNSLDYDKQTVTRIN